MSKQILKISISICFLLAISNFAKAATGDILANCTFEESGTTPSQVIPNCGSGWGRDSNIDTVASIVSGGHDGGKAISYYYPNLGGEVVKVFWTPAFNKQELTVDYWEKFDVDAAFSNLWNVKSMRAYVGPGGNDYMAGTLSRHNSEMWYQSRWGGYANLTPGEAASGFVNTNTGYCTGSGLNYTCGSVAPDDGRLELNYAQPWGTSWHHVRVYMKVPSTDVATDGMTKVWIDEKLLYTLTNIQKSPNWSTNWHPYTTGINFHPSDDFFEPADKTNCEDQVHACGPHTNTIDPAKPYCPWTCDKKSDFHHFYDDITVYDGYVPPSAAQTTFATSDFITLVSNWLKTGTTFDLNSDSIVNAKDLGMMMSKWQ